jgi:Ca2+-binding EF-hand superfamily protein
VYDLNGDGFVTREEVLQLLAGCLAAPAAADDDPDEGVRDLADMALRKMDADRDGKLSFADFEAAVSAEPLLLEAFGNCLPPDHISDSFIATLF